MHLLRAHTYFVGTLGPFGVPRLLNLAVLERILRFYWGALNCWHLMLRYGGLRGVRGPGLRA